MARTSRAAYPRAVMKDRSESRSGGDKSIRKSGAGPHNWGSLADEEYLEYAALEDEQRELEEEEGESIPEEVVQGASHRLWCSSQALTPDCQGSPKVAKSEPVKIVSPISDDELESAKEFRKKALKDQGLDRSLSLPYETLTEAVPLPGLDLSAIARTSSAVSTSPTQKTDHSGKHAVVGSRVTNLRQALPYYLICAAQLRLIYRILPLRDKIIIT